MYESILTSLGLGKKVAEVYETLLRIGPSPLPKIIENVHYKRGDLYNILTELEAWKLVEIKEKEGKKLYSPAHPSILEDALEEQEKELSQTKKTLQSTLPDLLSLYRSVSDRPGVRYFEGQEGVAEVLNDSLTAKEEIYTFADIEAIVKYINEVNKKYVSKREKLGITKKAIIADSPFARDFLKNYYRDVTDIRLIGEELKPFENVMQIYDNKVSYLTLNETRISGIIIQDENIYRMHRNLFDFTWKQLKPLSTATHLEKGDPDAGDGPTIVLNPSSSV